MRTHIDWLSFTMTPQYADDTHRGYANALNAAFVDMFNIDLAEALAGWGWTRRERSRAPYSDAWTIEDRGITLFASPTLTHCTVEISGAGCETLISENIMERVLAACAERVTRIDIACDIETDTRPGAFVAQTSHERMRASGSQRSDTGETEYVGSQKSDRYARVYRYYEPHPRAHLLRVEHVFRRDYAKVVAKNIVSAGIESVARAAGEAFGWSHSDWRPGDVEASDISMVNAETRGGNTVTWLVNACAPAFRRMVREGIITDPYQFFERYFLADD